MDGWYCIRNQKVMAANPLLHQQHDWIKANYFPLQLLVNLQTGMAKFGSLTGDHSKIGANAVLSPGTLLLPNSIVKRLELVNQLYDLNSTGC